MSQKRDSSLALAIAEARNVLGESSVNPLILPPLPPGAYMPQHLLRCE